MTEETGAQTTTWETEAKFRIPDAETLQRLGAQEELAGYALTNAVVKTVHDQYWDTNDRRLLQAGFALRRRWQEDGILMTLKGLGQAQDGVHQRTELQALLAAETAPAAWPAGELRDTVLNLVGVAELKTLFELSQTRAVRDVWQAERLVAELSLDEVHLLAGAATWDWRELEVELKPAGAPDDLKTIAARLRQDWHLEPQPLSKFEQALALLEGRPSASRLLTEEERAQCEALAAGPAPHNRRAAALLALDAGATQVEAGKRVGLSERRVRYWLSMFRRHRLGFFPKARVSPPPPAPIPPPSPTLDTTPAPASAVERPQPPARPGLTPNDSMTEVARKTLWFHFQHMLYHEPGTRLGEDIEELHDMRVAVRRMRTALEVFGPYVVPEQMAPFARGLRRTGRLLGAVRDLDVFREKLDHYAAGLPADQLAHLGPLLGAWETRRQEARQRMLAYLDSRRYRRFTERFGEFLQQPEAGAPPVITAEGGVLPHRVRHVAPALIWQRLAAVRAYDGWVGQPGAPLERYHQLRIAFKFLRYTIEYLRELLGGAAKTWIDEIKVAQDHLGDLQDAVIASQLLRNFLVWETLSAEPPADRRQPATLIAPGVAAYLAYRQTELQRLLDTFPQMWARIQSREFHKLALDAVAQLW